MVGSLAKSITPGWALLPHDAAGPGQDPAKAAAE